MQTSQTPPEKSRIAIGMGGRLYLDGLMRIREKSPLAERIFAPEKNMRFLAGEDLALARSSQPKHAEIYRQKVEWMASELYSEFGSEIKGTNAEFEKMKGLFRKAMDSSLEFMDFQRFDNRVAIFTYYDVLQTLGVKSSLAVCERETLVLNFMDKVFIGYAGGNYIDAYKKGKVLATPRQAASQLHAIFADQAAATGKESDGQYPGNENAAYLMQKAVRHYEFAAWHGKADAATMGDLLPLQFRLGRMDLLLEGLVGLATISEKKDMPGLVESMLDAVKRNSDHWAALRAFRFIEALLGREPEDLALQKAVSQMKGRLQSILSGRA